MTAVSMETLKELRNMTQAPLKDCKEALEEAGGDLGKAQQILKDKGALKAAKKADRETKEGIVVVKQIDGKVVSLILACETDFVAKNDTFRGLAFQIVDLLAKQVSAADSFDDLPQATKDEVTKVLQDNFVTIGENMQIAHISVKAVEPKAYIYVHPGDKIASVVWYEGDEQAAKQVALQVAAMNPQYLSAEDVPQAMRDELKSGYAKELEGSNKPQDIQEKIMEGKLQKDLGEIVLLEQLSIVDDTKKVKDMLGTTRVVAYSRYAI